MPNTKAFFSIVSVADLAFPPREGGYTKGHETREHILTAALGLLIEEGFHSLSMRRVAAASGMKLGNLTYHFPSREDLILALLEAVISSYEIEFDRILHMPSVAPEKRLQAYCQLVLEDIRTKKTSHFFPEIWALSIHDDFVAERLQDLYARARRPLEEVIEEIRPDLPAAKRADLAMFISASMEGLTVFAGHGRPFEPRMPTYEALAVRSFADLVLNIRAEDIP